MEEIKDTCQGLEVMSEEIAADLKKLPMDYRLAERYTKLDQEIYDISMWYEKIKKQKKRVEEKLKHVEHELRLLNNDVQNFKLREFSRAQRQDPYLP
jgi:chromosome segregation ATPase